MTNESELRSDGIMNCEELLDRIMSREELVESIVEQGTPINFDDLIARGILKRRSKTTFFLLKPKELPDAVSRLASGFSFTTRPGGRTVSIRIRDGVKSAEKMLAKIRRWPNGDALIRAAQAKVAKDLTRPAAHTRDVAPARPSGARTPLSLRTADVDSR
jgi:hypothetical protein